MQWQFVAWWIRLFNHPAGMVNAVRVRAKINFLVASPCSAHNVLKHFFNGTCLSGCMIPYWLGGFEEDTGRLEDIVKHQAVCAGLDRVYSPVVSQKINPTVLLMSS